MTKITIPKIKGKEFTKREKEFVLNSKFDNKKKNFILFYILFF